MLDWIPQIALIVSILGVLIWAGIRRYTSPAKKDYFEDVSLSDRLETLEKTLDLDDYQKYDSFGIDVHHLFGRFGDLQVDSELYANGRTPFARVSIEFSKNLAQGLRILSDRDAGLKDWFLRLREIEIGKQPFDEKFILLTRHPGYLKTFLNDPMRFQLERLFNMTHQLRVTDRELFLYLEDLDTVDEYIRVIKKAIDLADRCQRWRRQLPPPEKRSERDTLTSSLRDRNRSRSETTPAA